MMVEELAKRTGQRSISSAVLHCHENPPPDLLKEPPKLRGIFSSKTLPSGAPATDEQVRKVIIEGLGTMRAFYKRVKDDDVRDIIAYLHTLK